MANFSITLRDPVIRPDSRLTIRTDKDWGVDHHCTYDYETGEWRSPDLAMSDLPLQFKFVWDGRWEHPGHDVTLADIVAGTYRATPNGGFANAPGSVVVSNPMLAQRYFPSSVDPDDEFDVYVIGSGMGGGTFAHTALRQRKKVLVLEAGSYLFPTHVGNLPRRYENAQLWGLWYDLRTKRDQSFTLDGVADLAEGLCLGGKSVFWGALVPEMTALEFAPWPKDVHDDLTTRFYGHARDLLNAQRHPLTAYQKLVKDQLRIELPDLNHEDALMAVQRLPSRSWGVPAGVFSTADLLLEDRLHGERLTINLNHQVTELVRENQRVTRIITRDLITRTTREFVVPANADVVLAAGALSSPIIAANSGLNHPLAGRGLTDHATFYRKFRITSGPLFNPEEVCKTVSRRIDNDRPLNILLELGANLNQSRLLDDDVRVAGQEMLCEVVFLFAGALVEANRVNQDGSVTVRQEPADDLLAEVKVLSEQIITDVCHGEPGEIQRSPLGAVGHEAGTLRMGEDEQHGVVDQDLKVFGYDNLHVCDLSVFPSSPAANPSLTLAALAIRLAHHLYPLVAEHVHGRGRQVG